MAAQSLTETQFVEEVYKRLEGNGGNWSKSHVRVVVSAIKEEIVDCLINGYGVKLNGVLSIKPVHVKPKRKGEMVRNPATGEMAPRAEAKPASFKAKASASPAIAKQFPSVKTTAGKALEEALS